MDAAPDARIHLDTVITPQRSLSLTGFKVLLGALILANLIIGVFFLALGALPASSLSTCTRSAVTTTRSRVAALR